MPGQEDFEAIRHLVNNAPETDFDGFSFNEIHEILYHALAPDFTVQLKKHFG